MNRLAHLGIGLVVALMWTAWAWVPVLTEIPIRQGGLHVITMESYGLKELEDPYHPAVCVVIVEGVPTHSQGGCNPHWTQAEYTQVARADTAKEYNRLIGCPNIEDGEEMMELVRMFPEQGLGLDTKDKA